MAKICEEKFLNINKEQSSVYYNNQHLGKEIAERLYLESMASFAHTKFQKNPNLDAYIRESKSIKLDEKNHKYIKKNGKVFETSVTELTNSNKNPFDDTAQAVASALNNKARQLVLESLEKDAKKKYVASGDKVTLAAVRNNTFQLKDIPEAVEDARIFAWKNPADPKHSDPKNFTEQYLQEHANPLFIKRIEKMKKLWKFKEEAGTDIHAVIENFLVARNKLEPAEDGYIDYKEAIAIAIKDEKK